MTRDRWLCVMALLILSGLAGASWQQTRVIEQMTAAALESRRVAALEAQVRRLEARLRPPPYRLPLKDARLSSSCGYRTDPMGGGEDRLHKGVDLAAPIGTPVVAARAGVVAENWPAPDGESWRGHPVLGGLVVLDHGEGCYTLYGHLSETLVHEGQQVAMGQVIGLVGSTGVSTGPHLHFEVVIDPLRYLEGKR